MQMEMRTLSLVFFYKSDVLLELVSLVAKFHALN